MNRWVATAPHVQGAGVTEPVTTGHGEGRCTGVRETDDLTDAEWTAVRGLLPRCVPSGPDYRIIIDGMLWQQATGGRWHDMPTRYGPWHRCAERLRLWNSDGTWQNVLTTLAAGRPISTRTQESREIGEAETVDDWNTSWLR
ncbi:transposase [Streptomyces sp. NPDC046161]|uniref:transposase n=1 Tax=Streptomyces sp. NPDC046161 TaxID=3155132 RepID=UPI0033E2BA3E